MGRSSKVLQLPLVTANTALRVRGEVRRIRVIQEIEYWLELCGLKMSAVSSTPF